MIERLEIDGYRGLDGVRIDPLGHVNVIVGPMNSGKTSLLEAVFLFCSTGDPMLLPTALGLRRVRIGDYLPGEIGPQIDWVWSVGRADQSCAIAGTWCGEERHNHIRRIVRKENEILLQPDSGSSAGDEGARDLAAALSAFEVETVIGQESFRGQLYVRRDKLRVHADDRPNIKGRFLSFAEQGNSRELAPIWRTAADGGEDGKIVELLRGLDPDVEDVRFTSDDLGRAALCVRHRRLGRAVPVEVFGGGFGKALSVAASVVKVSNGVLAIDEFDASLHVAAQAHIVKFCLHAANRLNVQLFISTHSLETLDAFLDEYEAAKGLYSGADDLRVLQVKRADGMTVVDNLDADTAKRLREEIGVDLRRTV